MTYIYEVQGISMNTTKPQVLEQRGIGLDFYTFGYFSSFEKAENKIKTHSQFYIKNSCPLSEKVGYYIRKLIVDDERNLYIRDCCEQIFSYTNKGVFNDYSHVARSDFQGRTSTDIHHQEGDVVFFEDERLLRCGIVMSCPLTTQNFEKVKQEILEQDEDMFQMYSNGQYIIGVPVYERKTKTYGMFCMPTQGSNIFKLLFKPSEEYVQLMKKLRQNMD